MITRQTVVDKLEILNDGTTCIRLRKEIVEDGVVLHYDYHRCVYTKEESFESLMQRVNTHLATMGYNPVDVPSILRIQRIINAEHK